MESTKYQIRLENFHGPLDLLLHLIDKDEIDIYDIPIAQVTDQYLEYINEAQSFDLDIASEFLVMAATLLSIKAKMLLPKPPKAIAEEEEDPREELIARLLQYRQYKQAALYLQEQEQEMSRIFVREIDEAQLVKSFGPVNPVSNVTLKQLLGHYTAIIERAKQIPPVFEVSREEVAIGQCMDWITDSLQTQPQGLSFGELFPMGANRIRIVVTFLALLELIKVNKVKCRQTKTFGEIRLYLIED